MNDKRIFYGRTIVSIVLYVLFIIFSTVAVFAGTLEEQPLLLGGLLLGAVFLLPRTPRRPSKKKDEGEGEDDEPQQLSSEEAEQIRDVQKWLTVVRIAYLVIAVGLWFGLPAIV